MKTFDNITSEMAFVIIERDAKEYPVYLQCDRWSKDYWLEMRYTSLGILQGHARIMMNDKMTPVKVPAVEHLNITDMAGKWTVMVDC